MNRKYVEPDLDEIRKWSEKETGLTAIWEHSNAPRPSRPYLSVRVLSFENIHRENQFEIDGEGNAWVASNTDLTVSFQVHERADELDPSKALRRARILRASLDLPSVKESFRNAGIVIRGVELLQDNPLQLDVEWQQRANLDIRFGIITAMCDKLGLIESIEATGFVNGKTIAVKEESEE